MVRPFTYAVYSNPILNASERLNVLFAGESQTNPDHRLGPKIYDFYLLHHVLSGQGTFTCGQQHYELTAGHSFLIEPEQLVSYAADENSPWRYRWVAYTGEEARSMTLETGLHAGQPVVHTGRNRIIAKLLHRISEAFRGGQRYAHLQASGCLQLLLAELGSSLIDTTPSALALGGSDSPMLQRIIHYLSTQYTHPVSIERMAEALGYNRAYLSRVFKKHTGVSPVTFLLKLRIDKARQLLRERPELTIEQIAASVGFQDALYFSKQFRRYYDMTPSMYKETLRSSQVQK